MPNEFVTMIKDGEEPIEVHPSVVEDHQRLGWKLAEPTVPVEESAAEAGEAKPARKRVRSSTE